MPPAARITDMHVCPMVNPGPVPHVGGPIAMGAPTVFTGKLPQARVGDMAICVGPPDTIAKGSSGVFVTKRPAARLGDNTAHGGVIVAGLPTVIIGETGGGGGGSGGVSAGVSSNGFVGGGLAAVAFAQPPTMAEAMRAAAAAGVPFCEICFELTRRANLLVTTPSPPATASQNEIQASIAGSVPQTSPATKVRTPVSAPASVALNTAGPPVNQPTSNRPLDVAAPAKMLINAKIEQIAKLAGSIVFVDMIGDRVDGLNLLNARYAFEEELSQVLHKNAFVDGRFMEGLVIDLVADFAKKKFGEYLVSAGVSHGSVAYETAQYSLQYAIKAGYGGATGGTIKAVAGALDATLDQIFEVAKSGVDLSIVFSDLNEAQQRGLKSFSDLEQTYSKRRSEAIQSGDFATAEALTFKISDLRVEREKFIEDGKVKPDWFIPKLW